MEWKTVRYDRKVLYEQVWSEPILTVAKSYGVSNVGLAKICRRLRVPRPWRGYWAKVRNGEKLVKPKLAPLRPGEQEVYVANRWERLVLDSKQEAEFVEAASREKVGEERITVPPILKDPHRLVLLTEKSLRTGRKDEFGRTYSRARGRLDVKVSRSCADRALRIMDSTLKALETRGYKVSVGEGKDVTTGVKVLGETLSIWLEEEVDRTERPLTKKQQEERKEHSWMHSRPQYDYHLTGRLALRIGGPDRVGGRRTWADGTKQKVEECLNKFIEGLIRVAEVQKANRLEDERRQREWEEQQRRRDEEYRQQAEEKRRSELLQDQIGRWDRSRRIREYIAEMSSTALDLQKWRICDMPLLEWIEWALKYADKIDPISPIRRDREVKAAPKPASTQEAADLPPPHA